MSAQDQSDGNPSPSTYAGTVTTANLSAGIGELLTAADGNALAEMQAPGFTPDSAYICQQDGSELYSLAANEAPDLQSLATGWLRDSLGSAKPVVEVQPGFYHDSDGNYVLNNKSSFSLAVSNVQLMLEHQRTDAFGPVGHQDAEQALAAFSAPILETVSVNGGAGLSRMGGALLPIGRLKVTVDRETESAQAGISREAMAVNGKTIKYGIAFTNLALSMSYTLAEMAVFSLDYHYKSYSDRNHSNDVQISAGHMIHLKWSDLNLGWRLGYTDFASETAHGYFDPSNFFSYQPVADWSFDRGAYYADVELSGGRQAYRYTGEQTNEFMGAGSATFGVRASKRTSIEVNAEGGNYALGAPSGWNYYSTNVRLAYAF